MEPSKVKYIAVNSPQTHADAEAYCQTMYGTHLATIKSLAENNDVVDVISATNITSNYVWIGYNDIDNEGTWVWLGDTQNDTFTNWGSGQPNGSVAGEDCAHIYADSGLWNDQSCSLLIPFVCNAYSTTNETQGICMYMCMHVCVCLLMLSK